MKEQRTEHPLTNFPSTDVAEVEIAGKVYETWGAIGYMAAIFYGLSHEGIPQAISMKALDVLMNNYRVANRLHLPITQFVYNFRASLPNGAELVNLHGGKRLKNDSLLALIIEGKTDPCEELTFPTESHVEKNSPEPTNQTPIKQEENGTEVRTGMEPFEDPDQFKSDLSQLLSIFKQYGREDQSTDPAASQGIELAELTTYLFGQNSRANQIETISLIKQINKKLKKKKINSRIVDVNAFGKGDKLFAVLHGAFSEHNDNTADDLLESFTTNQYHPLKRYSRAPMLKPGQRMSADQYFERASDQDYRHLALPSLRIRDTDVITSGKRVKKGSKILPEHDDFNFDRAVKLYEQKDT